MNVSKDNSPVPPATETNNQKKTVVSWREIAFAALVAVGLALLSYGVGQAWGPGLFIVGGLSVVGLAMLLFAEV
jgi:hypothetical protein